MPYEVRKSGDKWNVVNKENGEVKTSRDNQGDAKRAAAAYNDTDYQKAAKVGGGSAKKGGGVFDRINKALTGR